jgi:hydroxyacylglutathione hydrolase
MRLRHPPVKQPFEYLESRVGVIPLVDEGLGNSALVVDLGDGGALVVDPERDPRPYLRELDRHGLTARFVVRTTTIGRERASNPLLADGPDEDTLVSSDAHRRQPRRRLLGGLGTYPPYFLELRDVNRAGPAVHGPTPPPLPQLDLTAFDAAVADGAEVVDVRQIDRFAEGHVPGSLSNPWRAQFATWLGWLVGREQPVVFVVDDTVDRHDLAWAALTVGFEHLVGELAGGVDTWQDAGRRLATTPLVDAAGAERRQVLGIRQQDEFAAGHVTDALHAELGASTRPAEGIPHAPSLVRCGHGERAMSATSLLQRAGHDEVAVLAGGPDELGELEAGAGA